MRRAARVLLTRSPRLYRAARQALQAARFVARRPHEPEFAAFAQLRQRAGLFLDVGANTGTSAMSFRIFRREEPILSVEPNADLERELRLVRRLVRRMDYMLCAAGEEDGELPLYVPVYRGVAMDTVASARRDAVQERWSLRRQLGARVDGPALRIQERVVPVRRLDGLGLAPGFVKLDVEGFELEVLRGLRETIERTRPVVLVERSASFDEVSEFLGRYAYRPFAYVSGDFAPYERHDVTNVFFLPPDVAPTSPPTSIA
jgi:FkbM family methyltransferase